MSNVKFKICTQAEVSLGSGWDLIDTYVDTKLAHTPHGRENALSVLREFRGVITYIWQDEFTRSTYEPLDFCLGKPKGLDPEVFVDVQLTDINKPNIGSLVNYLIAKIIGPGHRNAGNHLTYDRKKGFYSIVNGFLGWVADYNVGFANPCFSAKTANAKLLENSAFYPEQEKVLETSTIQAILKTTRDIFDMDGQVAFLLVAHTAPRESELLSAEWKHFHLDQHYLATGFLPGARKTAKTPKGIRFFFPESVGRVLKAYKFWMDQHYPGSPFLFPPTRPTKLGYRSVGWLSDRIKDIRQKLGIDLCSHWFRHTLISHRRDDMGCPPDISDRLQCHVGASTQEKFYHKTTLEQDWANYKKYHPYQF